MTNEQQIARALLEIKAVVFRPNDPIIYKSGIKAPIYVDNRKFPFHPAKWKKVIRGFISVIEEKHLKFDVIAGIETAGIPHSAALGYALNMPSIFVRKKPKDHGTKSKIEGGDVSGKRVLLIEDHVSTGMSSLAGVAALREAGAKVTTCLSITSLQFKEATDAFRAAKVTLYTLSPFSTIIAQAEKWGYFTGVEKETIEEWFKDPRNWKK